MQFPIVRVCCCVASFSLLLLSKGPPSKVWLLRLLCSVWFCVHSFGLWCVCLFVSLFFSNGFLKFYFTFYLLLWVRWFEWFNRVRGTSVYFLHNVCTYVRVTLTLTEHLRDNLFLTGGFGVIVDQHIPIRLCGDFSIHRHEIGSIFCKHPFGYNVNLLSITGASKQDHILCISANICVEFSFGKHVL